MTWNIVRTILSCIVKYYSSDYFSSLLSKIWYYKEHSDIVQNCQIYPIIVRHSLILSSIGQYCLVTPCSDIFHLNLILNPELEIVVELGNLVPRKNLVSQKVFLILRYLQSWTAKSFWNYCQNYLFCIGYISFCDIPMIFYSEIQ